MTDQRDITCKLNGPLLRNKFQFNINQPTEGSDDSLTTKLTTTRAFIIVLVINRSQLVYPPAILDGCNQGKYFHHDNHHLGFSIRHGAGGYSTKMVLSKK